MSEWVDTSEEWRDGYDHGYDDAIGDVEKLVEECFLILAEIKKLKIDKS
jgi:hypothetical protein